MGDLRSLLYDVLAPLEQTHLLAYADSWGAVALDSLLRQVKQLDLALLCQQQELIHHPPLRKTYPPLLEGPEQGSSTDAQIGQRLMREGRCGCVVLAGGQSSRLRLTGPKGVLPISLIRHKSLFQLIAEKILAASLWAGHPLPLAMMTSVQNRVETELFFLKHKFFGLEPSQVSFFSQNVWPLLSPSGDLILESEGKLALGPNGNGDFFSEFVHNGVWTKWRKQGVDFVRVVPIDNPLALPLDPELLGFHYRQQYDVSMQAIRVETGKEKMGTFCLQDDHILVAEYGECDFPENRLANPGLYLFSMPFIEQVHRAQLPLHAAMKAVRTVEQPDVPVVPNAWKMERFIFDVLHYTKNSGVLLYPREECFAPLKTLQGKGSIEGVQHALLYREQLLYAELAKLSTVPSELLELSPSCYYPSQELLDWVYHRPVREGEYIESNKGSL